MVISVFNCSDNVLLPAFAADVRDWMFKKIAPVTLRAITTDVIKNIM